MLHFFMNSIWTIFSVSENALGGTIANILRLLTVAFINMLAIRVARKKYDSKVATRNLIL